MAHVGAARFRGGTRWTDEGLDTDPRVFLPSLGIRRALMLCVDFPDAAADAAPAGRREARAYFDWLAPGGANFLRLASFGRLRLEVDLHPRWLRMSGGQRSYGFRRGISSRTHARYIEEAVRLAAPEAALARYDLIYVVPPAHAAGVAFSPAYIDRGAGIAVDGHAVRHAVTFGQDMWRWGPRVVAHETLHTLGLPDLYAFEPEGEPPDTHAYVGGWDVMGWIAGHAPDLFAWHKWKLGWLDDAQLAVLDGGAGVDEHRVTPVEAPGGLKAVVVPVGERRAVVVECRRRLGLDAEVRRDGVLAYTVDTGVRTGQGPVRVLRPASAVPEGRRWHDYAALGLGGGRAAAVEDRGVRVEVLEQDAGGDLVRVTRGGGAGGRAADAPATS